MAARRTVVGAVVLDRDTACVLAARRTRPPVGRWEFPGGKVEPGETPRAALVREVHEELGAELEVGEQLLGPGPEGAWPISEALELRLFLAVVLGPAPRAGDSHDALRWVDADGLDRLDWLDSDRAALPVVREALGAVSAGPRRGED